MSENAAVTATPMRQRVAEEVRVLLARKMLSASELARRIGVTQPYISRRLTGEIAFDVDDLAKVAQALDVPVTKLLPGTIAQTVRAPKQSRYGAVRTIRASDAQPPRQPTPPVPATVPADRAIRLPAAYR